MGVCLVPEGGIKTREGGELSINSQVVLGLGEVTKIEPLRQCLLNCRDANTIQCNADVNLQFRIAKTSLPTFKENWSWTTPDLYRFQVYFTGDSTSHIVDYEGSTDTTIDLNLSSISYATPYTTYLRLKNNDLNPILDINYLDITTFKIQRNDTQSTIGGGGGGGGTI